MIQLGFVWVRFGVRLCDTLRDYLGVTFLVTCVVAVGALHPCSVLEELAAESTTHDVVELLLHELVAVLLHHIFFALPDCTLSAESKIEWLLVASVLCK